MMNSLLKIESDTECQQCQQCADEKIEEEKAQKRRQEEEEESRRQEEETAKAESKEYADLAIIADAKFCTSDLENVLEEMRKRCQFLYPALRRFSVGDRIFTLPPGTCADPNGTRSVAVSRFVYIGGKRISRSQNINLTDVESQEQLLRLVKEAEEQVERKLLAAANSSETCAMYLESTIDGTRPSARREYATKKKIVYQGRSFMMPPGISVCGKESRRQTIRVKMERKDFQGTKRKLLASVPCDGTVIETLTRAIVMRRNFLMEIGDRDPFTENGISVEEVTDGAVGTAAVSPQELDPRH